MPSDFRELAYSMFINWTYASNEISSMASKLWSAGYYLETENFASAGSNLKAAANFAYDYCDYIWDGYYGAAANARDALYWIDDNWPDGVAEYELTYQKICEAWGKDDFEGRSVTIAFIDRMRQLIWNEPFSAIWAAKPEETL